MIKNNTHGDRKQVDVMEIEERWRAYWKAIDLYQTGSDPQKPNITILDFFPYPSGAGLSVGHCRNYIPTCVSARFHRMQGYNVLHPMGWDAFGLPAENYAIEHGIHPRESSAEFCATYRRQMKLIACSYDWSREISSTDPEYYRWTQWFFLLLYKRDLAYRSLGSQWWCRNCQTILANEQVENGRCWRCDTLVVKKELEQWHFRITDYAERLLNDLDTINWPESIKTMQRNWIGRSEGIKISFAVQPVWHTTDGQMQDVVVFTTRPDTLYGVTFLALAPEHPQAAGIATHDRAAAVEGFIHNSGHRSERERSADTQEMPGVFSGRFAIHPLTGESIPVWIADYVLPGYGTGAIMGVPAHDERDFAFASLHDLPVIEVTCPLGGAVSGCYSGHGTLINSSPFNGEASATAAERITSDLLEHGIATKQVNYKMRDWLISRQRYWGAPIPVVHCPDCGIVPVPEAELPVLLPDTDDFAPSGDGRSPLARVESWVNTICPECGGPAQRETDTMDGFACSSWYYLRFASPHYQGGPFEEQAMRTWMPVDTYVGGVEHAVMHLLYSRFWTKVMHDEGLVPFVEPFTSLMNQGVLHSAVDGQRMSKSRGNVVTPDEVVAAHGTDALRVYVLFLGPFDADVVWDDRGIKGITRFLDRFWRLATRSTVDLPREGTIDPQFEQRKHQTIRRVTEDMRKYRFNTAVATLMAYLNFLNESWSPVMNRGQWRSAVETFTLLLCPMAPFISEEVWQNVLGYQDSVHRQTWPIFDAEIAEESKVTVIVQVNGRVRDRVHIQKGASEEKLQAAALDSARVRRYMQDQQIRRIVIVPDQLVNIVV